MLGGIAKGITKQIQSLRVNKERRVLILSILNLIIGSIMFTITAYKIELELVLLKALSLLILKQKTKTVLY